MQRAKPKRKATPAQLASLEKARAVRAANKAKSSAAPKQKPQPKKTRTTKTASKQTAKKNINSANIDLEELHDLIKDMGDDEFEDLVAEVRSSATDGQFEDASEDEEKEPARMSDLLQKVNKINDKYKKYLNKGDTGSIKICKLLYDLLRLPGGDVHESMMMYSVANKLVIELLKSIRYEELHILLDTLS